MFQLQIAVEAEFVGIVSDAIETDSGAVACFETKPNGPWLIEAFFDNRPDQAAITTRLEILATALAMPPLELNFRAIEDRDWVSHVQNSLTAVRAGRFFVHGSHEATAAPSGSFPLQVDAARAFGTGHHESTHGCLQALCWLADRMRIGRALDIGCGSGILAMAMVKLWQARVIASDIDAIATAIAKNNARANGTAPRITFVTANGLRHPLLRRQCGVDLVTANILARPLRRLARPICRQLRPGGFIILAGLTVAQIAWVMAPYGRLGCRIVKQFRHNGWAALVLQRPQSPAPANAIEFKDG